MTEKKKYKPKPIDMKKYNRPDLRTLERHGTIELVVFFDYATDNDGSFVRCVIAYSNTTKIIVGDWRRDKDDAFRVAMEKIVSTKLPNTVH